MIKMVAVDMDGTFLNENKEYNRSRFKKIYREMKRKEIKFVVASGNQYYQLKSFFPEISDEISFVAENGALVISEKEELFCGKFEEPLVHEMLAFLSKSPQIQVLLCGRKSAYVDEKESEDFKQTSKKFYHRLKTVTDLTQLEEDVFFKFALSVPKEETEKLVMHLNKEFQGKFVAVSSGHGELDLIIPGFHKANGLEILQKKWGISDEELATFGDGGNDVEMLRKAAFSYAMANGSQAVKHAANYSAPSNEEEGVLKIVEELLELGDEKK